jgi:hypothetical protein
MAKNSQLIKMVAEILQDHRALQVTMAHHAYLDLFLLNFCGKEGTSCSDSARVHFNDGIGQVESPKERDGRGQNCLARPQIIQHRVRPNYKLNLVSMKLNQSLLVAHRYFTCTWYKVLDARQLLLIATMES